MNAFKQLLLILFLTGSLLVSSQPLVPQVWYKNGFGKNGYFFLFPYKMGNGTYLLNHMQLILDGHGDPVYYKHIRLASDFKVHANGLMSYYANEKFYIMDSTFLVTDSVSCKNGIVTDAHDFLILQNGHYLLIGTEIQQEDYHMKMLFTQKSIRGSKTAKVKYGVVQELDENKNVVFQWKSKNVYTIDDVDRFYLKDSQNIDLTHFNSIDVDAEGNMIISVRYFNEVIKIKRTDGSVIWRMGGKKNQIKVLNDSLPFLGQHDARFTKLNRFVLFDNGYTEDSLTHNVRALEYEVNDREKTAFLIRSYSNKKMIISDANGNAHWQKDSSLLVSYGKIKGGTPNITFELVDKNGQPLLEVSFPDTVGTYRTFYYPELPFKINRPGVNITQTDEGFYLETKGTYKNYLWSNGEKGRQIKVSGNESYHVCVSEDNSRFFCSEKVVISLPAKTE